jgi:hypothetical protein
MIGWMVIAVVVVSAWMALQTVTNNSISRATSWNVFIDESMILPTTMLMSSLSDASSTFRGHLSSLNTSVGSQLLPFSVSELLPLEDLLNTAPSYDCPSGQVKVTDLILPSTITHANRRIPRVIHMTAKNRCVPPFVLEHIQRWRTFANHSFLFWDDDAVDRLLALPVVNRLFPNLTKVSSCVTTGATKSDIWRYVALYLYGGIYTDVDSAPTSELDLNELILPDDTAWSTIEQIGVPSQYFIASAPGHPWMYLSMKRGLEALYTIPNVMVNNPAQSTGPNALKVGFILFQEALNITTAGYEPEGFYEGDYLSTDRPGGMGVSTTTPWTIHLIGSKNESARYVDRNGLVGPLKHQYWRASNMSHYHGKWKQYPRTGRISCAEHISRQEQLWNGTYYQRANYEFVDGVYIDLNQAGSRK